MKKIRILLLICLFGLLLLIYLGYLKDEDVKIKIGYRNTAGSFATLIAKEQNLFEKNGLNVEFVTFMSGSESYNALVRGDIQYDPYVTIIPLLLGNANEPGAVKITRTSSITAEEKFDQLLVKNESQIDNIVDLSKKRVGVNPGSTAMTFLKVALKRNGVDPDSLTYVQLPSQSQLIALESGSIDVLMAYEPVIAVALESGKYRTVYHSLFADAFPGSPMIGSLVSSKFAMDYPDLVKELDKIYTDAQDYALTYPDEVKDLIANELKVSRSVADRINLSYLGNTNIDVVKKFIDTLYDLGEIKSKPNISDIIYDK